VSNIKYDPYDEFVGSGEIRWGDREQFRDSDDCALSSDVRDLASASLIQMESNRRVAGAKSELKKRRQRTERFLLTSSLVRR